MRSSQLVLNLLRRPWRIPTVRQDGTVGRSSNFQRREHSVSMSNFRRIAIHGWSNFVMVRLYNVAQRLLELGFACWRQMVCLSLPRKHAALVPESLN